MEDFTVDDKIKQLLEEKSNEKLETAFNVISDNFSNISIEMMELSVRSTNCLTRARCSTVGELLKLSFLQLSLIRNLGNKSACEILDKLTELLDKRNLYSLSMPAIIDSLQSQISSYFLNCTNIEEEIDTIEKIANILPRNAQIGQILSRLDSLKPDNINFLDLIPERIKDEPVCEYIKTFCLLTGSNSLLETINDKITVSDFLSSNNAPSTDITRFVNWISIDYEAKWNKVSDIYKNEREHAIMVSLMSGKTLEETGKLHDVSRQRIRQIQEKILNKVKHYLINNHLMNWIVLKAKANPILGKEDLKKMVPDNSFELFWYALSKGIIDEEKKWSFSKEHQSLIIELFQGISLDTIKSLIGSLPNEMSNEIVEEYLLSFMDTYHCDLSLFVHELDQQYYHYNEFYTRTKFNLSDMTAYVLREKFTEGYHISDEQDFSAFRNHLKTIFQYDTSSLNMNSLAARIADCGFLCNKGTYKHISYLTIPDDVKTFLTEYIEHFFSSTARSTISYNEIFEKNKAFLLDNNIINQYVLHSVILSLNMPYRTSRDYILLTIDSVFDNDFVDYIKASYPISVSKVSSHFCMSETQVFQVAARCLNIIVHGKSLIYKRDTRTYK